MVVNKTKLDTRMIKIVNEIGNNHGEYLKFTNGKLTRHWYFVNGVAIAKLENSTEYDRVLLVLKYGAPMLSTSDIVCKLTSRYKMRA